MPRKLERELDITKAKETLIDIVERVQYQGATYIISQRGKPAAAVVHITVHENWKRRREAFFDAVRRIESTNEEVDPSQVMEDVL